MTGSSVPEASAQAAEAAFDETGVKRELAGFAAMAAADSMVSASSMRPRRSSAASVA